MLRFIWDKNNSGIIGTIENSYKKNVSKSSLTTPDTYELNKIISKCAKKNRKPIHGSFISCFASE